MKRRDKRLNDLLKEASRIRGFPVYRSSFERFISLLRGKRPVDLWDIIRSSEEHITVIMEIMEEMRLRGLLSIDSAGKIRLTEAGMRFTEPLAPPHPMRRGDRYGMRLNPPLRSIFEVIKNIYPEITPKDEYDQAPLLPDSAIYKAAYMINRGDVASKEVVCVGDDDMISVILALTGLPRRITALDIDEGVLSVIERASFRLKLDIKTYRHDLRNPIPKSLSHKFDTFVTEPPDTVKGITSFVSRGVELLKEGPGRIGYLGISPTACPPLGLLKIQEGFTKMGLVITDMLPKFNEYPPVRTELKHVEVPECYEPFYPPPKVWYLSDLVRLKTTRMARPLFRGVVRGGLSDYKGDARRFI